MTATTSETNKEGLVEVEAKELERLRRVDDQLKSIEQKEVVVRKLKDDWDRKKDAALAAKKLFDEADAELRDLIAAKESPQMQLPFGTHAATAADAPERELAPVTTGWEAVPVSALVLGKGLCGKLVEHGIKTVGDLEARRRDHGRALDLKGIGPAHSDTISNALDEWLRSNRDKAVFDAAATGGLSVVSPDDEPLPEVGQYFKLDVEIKAGEATHPVGGIYQVAEEMGDGRIALCVTPGSDDVFSVDPAEGHFISVARVVKRIRITQPVPGWDGVRVGDEFDVVNWHGDNALVKYGEADCMVAAAEFVAVNPELVEVASVEEEAAADAMGG